MEIINWNDIFITHAPTGEIISLEDLYQEFRKRLEIDKAKEINDAREIAEGAWIDNRDESYYGNNDS